MSWSIRELEDGDWDAVAALTDLYDKEGYTGKHLREMAARLDPEDPRERLVALADGQIVGYSRCYRRASDPPRKFMAMVYVEPAETGKGIGRELAARVEQFAGSCGGAQIDSFVDDRCERGNAFARRRGYEGIQHLFESNLSLENLDLTAFFARKAELEREGYSFFTLAEVGYTDENRRRLHALDVETDVDTPGFENWGVRPYERYITDEHGSPGFTADGVHVVSFEGEWVGMNSVRPTQVPGTIRTDYTGVRRAHRGKDLAEVLKALGLEYGRATGMATMNTFNDERNSRMLAINRKFGFVAEPGFVVYRKQL